MTFQWPMAPDTLITDEAATGLVGQQISVTLEDGVEYQGWVQSAVVTDEGRGVSVEVTFTNPDGWGVGEYLAP
jgi:hypothetical protein